jgi:hypothetical protein
VSRAAEAFDAMLAELGIDERDVDPVDLGRRGALLAAADLVWARHLGPSYETKQVRELLGSSRQAVHERAKRGTLLALRGGDGQPRFPAFQFGPTGKPLPALGEILDVLRPVAASPYTIASWFVTEDAELEGKTPAEWLREGRDPDHALRAAGRYAARLAQ